MTVDPILVFAGSGSPRLTRGICDHLGIEPGAGEVLLYGYVSAENAVDHARQRLALGSRQALAAEPVGLVQDVDHADDQDRAEPRAEELPGLLHPGRRSDEIARLEVQHEIGRLRHGHADRGADHHGRNDGLAPIEATGDDDEQRHRDQGHSR